MGFGGPSAETDNRERFIAFENGWLEYLAILLGKGPIFKGGMLVFGRVNARPVAIPMVGYLRYCGLSWP